MPTAERFDFDIEDIPSYFDCDGLTKNALVLPATLIVVLIIPVKLLLSMSGLADSILQFPAVRLGLMKNILR